MFTTARTPFCNETDGRPDNPENFYRATFFSPARCDGAATTTVRLVFFPFFVVVFFFTLVHSSGRRRASLPITCPRLRHLQKRNDGIKEEREEKKNSSFIHSFLVIDQPQRDTSENGHSRSALAGNIKRNSVSFSPFINLLISFIVS